jgi:hypothetical protein
MRKIEEVLRLKYGKGLSHRGIGRSCGVSAATTSDYVMRAKFAGLSWPLPEGLSEEELEERLFPACGQQTGREIAQPDWARIHHLASSSVHAMSPGDHSLIPMARMSDVTKRPLRDRHGPEYAIAFARKE